MSTRPAPTPEEIEDLLLSCRYGETEEIENFISTYGPEHLDTARDERGNTVLHMCCGNGHVDVLTLIEPHLSPALYTMTNESGTPPLHWAILNNHLPIVQRFCSTEEPTASSSSLIAGVSQPSATTPAPSSPAPTSTPTPTPYHPPTPTRKTHLLSILHQTNSSSRDALHESVWAGEGKEELAGWLEGLLDRLEPVFGEEAKDEKEGEVEGKEGEEAEVREVTDKVDGVKL